MEKIQRYTCDSDHGACGYDDNGELIHYEYLLSRLEWERKRAKWYAEMIGEIIGEAQSFKEDRKRERDFHVIVGMYNYILERSGRKAEV